MSLLGFIDKIDDIVYEPVKLACDYLRQPANAITAKIDIDKQKKEHEMLNQDKQTDFQIEKQRKEHEMQMRIQEKISNAKIDEYIEKSKLNVRKDIFDTIKQYQTDLTNAVRDCVYELGKMSIELREKANNLMIEKVEQYKELQEECKANAKEQLIEIGQLFADNERVRIRMEDEIIDQMHNMIKTADKFMNELSEDIKRLNYNIDDLSKNGQKMVEEYLKPMAAQIGQNGYNANVIEQK